MDFIGLCCLREVYPLHLILASSTACLLLSYNRVTNWLLSLLAVAWVGKVCLPQQNHKLVSKSYYSNVNIYLYTGVCFLASPLQIQVCLRCNNLPILCKWWQIMDAPGSYQPRKSQVNYLAKMWFIFHLDFKLQIWLFRKQFKSACSC